VTSGWKMSRKAPDGSWQYRDTSPGEEAEDQPRYEVVHVVAVPHSGLSFRSSM
jgi:hypothetical protein